MGEVLSFGFNLAVYFPSDSRSSKAHIVLLALMNHKYMGSIVAFSTSKSVEPNKEQKEMTSGFRQGNVCKC